MRLILALAISLWLIPVIAQDQKPTTQECKSDPRKPGCAEKTGGKT